MKKISYLIFMLCCSFLLLSNVYAASISMRVTSSSVTLGNSVTITTTVNSSNTIFFIEGSLSCSGAGVSKTQSLTFDNTSNNVYSKSFSLSVKPTTTGKITCTTKNVKIIDSSQNNWQTLDNKTSNITVNKAYVAPPKVYSSNSYLSSLTVDGYTLDNKFDKELLEYSVTVKEGTEKVKINAQLADSAAKVSGLGEHAVTEGINTLNIVVTAENGSKRTYVLNVTVKEFEPIEVTLGGEDYTVVRKRKDLPKISDYFIEKDITVLEEVVEGYYNEKLDYEVVALKDKLGNIKYYVYDDEKYYLYNEQIFNGMVLRVLDKEVSSGYKKTSFVYNDNNIISYQEVKLDILKNTYALDNNDITGNNFYLFYAVNMETGKEELYQYDSIEKTVQRYNTLILDMYREQSNKYYLYLLCSILVLGVTIVTFSAIIICGNKKRKKIESNKNSRNYKGRRNSRRNIERDLEL